MGKPTDTKGSHPYRSSDRLSFVAKVAYIQPDFDELRRWFPSYVDPDFKGVQLDPIDCCKDVTCEVREVTFEYFHALIDASTEDVLNTMDSNGLRPALFVELLWFGLHYQDEQRKGYPIVALGSVAEINGRLRVAFLWGGCCRDLRLGLVDHVWSDRVRFLAVRKVALAGRS